MVVELEKPLLTDPKQYASEAGKASGNQQGYDYIIVGGGTAGSVLASRLTEDKEVTVLVIEAGKDHQDIIETKIPVTFSKLFHGEHDWNYYTKPQAAVANRALYWPRGRMIGGSSSMNAMMHHHCSHSDFDEWEQEFGCKGWSYKDILPYMRRSEKFTPNKGRPAIDAKHRGNEGFWQTGYSWLTEIGEKGFLGGCEEVGIPYNPDINTPEGTNGATRFQTFIDTKGQRSSAATAYLPSEVRSRSNLHIAVGALITRVLFDKDGSQPVAQGVEFQTTKGGPLYNVHCRKEVILCAGSINTPQTLQLSGIGPKDVLQKAGIPVLKELEAVGHNLKDHFCTSTILCKAKAGTTLDYLSDPEKAQGDLEQWLKDGTGPLTSNVGEVAAFIRTVDPPIPLSGAKPKDYGSGNQGPDIEIIGTPMAYLNHGEEGAPPGSEVFSMVPIGLRPQSKGTITIQSKDVFDPPVIDPGYWTDKEDNDRKVLLVGIRVSLQIVRSKAFQKYLDPVPENDDPNSYWWPYSSSNIDAITDDQLLEWMKKTAFTLYHPIGTARMGPDEKDSVVDLQCRVYGVKGLRVVDASIMPEQISGHPTAPIIAIAEKMSDVIRGKVSINSDATKTAPIKKFDALPAK